VLIWLNGGPGCSSLLGAFSENGPFIFDDGQNVIKPNFEAWNSRANVLYIESPAHIGFSIGGPNDWNFTDITQAEDLFASVQSFFTLFPEYLANPLWVSGESYAGIYGPFLAYKIHSWNQAASMYGKQTYNLKGFVIGNGITDWTVDAQPATYRTFYEMNIIPQSLFDQFKANGCVWNVATNPTNPQICNTLDGQVN
jgi:carboxypeptidase C (cathepsin A)